MSSRLERMQEDVQTVINLCQADPQCPFKDFEVSEHFFSFRFTGNSKSRQYTFHVSDDYPEHTLMSCSDNNQPRTVSEPIPTIFDRITSELYKPLPVYVPSGSSSSDEEPMETENGPAGGRPLDRMVSNESNFTDCASDFTSDDWDDDYYNDGDCDDEEDEVYMHPLLCQDMELVKLIFGERSLSYRLFGAIDDIDVELHVNMSFLDAEIAKAWKVIREEPIVIRLHLSVSRYLDATEPKVEVFQPSQKEKFGVGSQMRKVMEAFLSENWRKLSNDVLQTKYSPKSRPRKNSGNSSPPKKKLHTQMSNSEGGIGHFDATVDDGNLARIIEMGFSAELGRNALIITRGSVEEALNLLISSPDSCKDVKVTSTVSSALDLPLPAIPMGASQSKPPRTNRQHSYPKGVKEKGRGKAVTQRQTSGYTSAPPSVVDLAAASTSPLDDLNLLPSTTASGKNAKQVPGLEHGFLHQVMMYTRQRLPTLNEYCVVCDEPHVFQNGAMLKPAVCARELCVFAFQTLGVMSDAAEDIATGAEVVDLLIAMAKAACTSHRKEIILDPFPTVVDPTNPTELALHPKKKDFQRVDSALEHFPGMHNMTSLVGSDLKKEMDRYDVLAYPLLQWIITSNRSHIVKLPPEKQLGFMHTPHQFLLMSSPPWKEAVFRAAKAKHGSTFAFHGSHIENWHSIMRIGLINASGTKHQMHGAAYGNGIYLSPHAGVSFGYSGMGYGHHRPGRAGGSGGKATSSSGKMRFFKSKNLTCIALCEAITSPELKKTSNIWVMPNPDHVCTRFFFVYEDGQVGDQNIDTQNDKYKKEIAKAVSFQTR